MRTRVLGPYRKSKFEFARQWMDGSITTQSMGVFFPNDSRYYGNNSGPGYSEYQRIQDDADSPYDHISPKFCLHEKYQYASFDENDVMKYYFPDNTPTARFCYRGGVLDTKWPYIPPFPAGQLVDMLASQVKGNISSRLSLPVFLIEGARTLEMIKNPFKLLRPDFRKRVRKLTAAQLLKRGADIWLEHLFGWRQFKSDVDEIASRTATFLNSTDTKVFQDQEERFSASLQVPLLDDEEEYNLGTTGANWHAQVSDIWWSQSGYHIGLFRKSSVRSAVIYRLGCRQRAATDRILTRTQKFLNASGANVNFQTVRDTLWEIVPFSFVIDWFVDTRGLWYLPNVEHLLSVGAERFCYSTTYDETYKVDWCPDPYIFDFQIAGKNPQYLTTKHRGTKHIYERRVGLPAEPPAVINAFALKGLSWNQLVTGGALIAQRTR